MKRAICGRPRNDLNEQQVVDQSCQLSGRTRCKAEVLAKGRNESVVSSAALIHGRVYWVCSARWIEARVHVALKSSPCT